MASALPMPLEAPVTKITFPFKEISIVFEFKWFKLSKIAST
jgi:hypothetical protein